jgi:putative FmdB family regulatory protein
MPLYDFACTECGDKFEKRLPFSGSTSDVTCPRGHHAVRRIYSSPQVVFKGSGWYITDHRKTTSTPATGSGTSE